jgi:HTH-type transcriptional regulator / antitoxin HipB
MTTMTTTIDSPRALGRAVRTVRRELRLSQDDLALASGTGRRFIVNLEAGKPTVQLDLVLSVLAALGLRLELHEGRRSEGARDAGA